MWKVILRVSNDFLKSKLKARNVCVCGFSRDDEKHEKSYWNKFNFISNGFLLIFGTRSGLVSENNLMRSTDANVNTRETSTAAQAMQYNREKNVYAPSIPTQPYAHTYTV